MNIKEVEIEKLRELKVKSMMLNDERQKSKITYKIWDIVVVVILAVLPDFDALKYIHLCPLLVGLLDIVEPENTTFLAVASTLYENLAVTTPPKGSAMGLNLLSVLPPADAGPMC